MVDKNNVENNENEVNDIQVNMVDEDYINRFKELKEGFDKELKKRDKEIEDLKKQLSEKDKTVDDTIGALNDEVKDKLEQAEEFREMQHNMNKLLDENATIAIDNYIKEGKIAPAQKETAKELYLSNREMFDKLYKDAPIIIDTANEPQSKRDYGDVEKIAAYFKS